MATAQPAPANRPQQPFQFTLRQLLWLMAIVCFIGSAYSWLGLELSLGLACMGVIFFIAYLATQKQINEAIVVTMVVCLFIALLLPIISVQKGPSRRMSCQNNLHNLALALQCYHDDYRSYPPAYLADENGKPMHSWRVLILPYIEQKNLYDLYSFNEPWDGPNNRKLHGVVLQLYSCPAHASNQPPTVTSYVAVVGPQTVWPGENATKMSDIKDGVSKTLLIVETHNSGIHWMEPRDLDFSKMPMTINPPQGGGFSSPHSTLAQGAFADGSVRAMIDDTPPATVRAILTVNGGEKVPDF